MRRIRLLFMFAVLAAPRLLGQDCNISGGINAPDYVYQYSTGNAASAAPDRGAEPLVTNWRWAIDGGTITSIAADKKSITFSVDNPGSQVFINLWMTAGPGCERPARTAVVDVIVPPPVCPDLTLDNILTAPAAANHRSIIVEASCQWTVAHLPSWLSVVSGGAGNGNGTIVLAFQRNSDSRGRQGVFIVNEQEVVVYQQGVNSVYPDYNRDGITDLLWRNTGGGLGLVATSFMNGVATNGGRWITGEVDIFWNAYPAGDFDANGMSDLYWVKTGTPYNNIHDLKRVQETYGVANHQIAHTPKLLAGFLDFRNFIATLPVWANANGSVGTSPDASNNIWTVEPNWNLVAIADLDGNVQRDVVYRHLDGRCFAVLRGGPFGNITTSAVFHTEPDPDWQITATGDVNGDGRTDLVWRNTADGRIWTMLMNGHSWTPGAVVWTEADANWLLKGTGDFNGDGRSDLLFRHQVNGMVFVVLLDGNTAIASGVAHYEPDLNWKLVGPTTTRAMLAANSSSVP